MPGGGGGPSRAETRPPPGVSALLGPYAGSARLSRPPQPGMSRHTRARVDTAEPEPAGSGGPGRGCLLAAFALASTLAALRSCEDARKYVQKMDLHLGLLWSRLRATMSCRLYLSLSVPFSLISPHPHPCYLPANLPVSASREKSRSRDSRLGNLAKMSDQVSPPSLPPSLPLPPCPLALKGSFMEAKRLRPETLDTQSARAPHCAPHSHPRAATATRGLGPHPGRIPHAGACAAWSLAATPRLCILIIPSTHLEFASIASR